MSNKIFRETPFNGYNRDDVLEYIEKADKEARERENGYVLRIDELTDQIEALESKIAEDMQAEKDNAYSAELVGQASELSRELAEYKQRIKEYEHSIASYEERLRSNREEISRLQERSSSVDVSEYISRAESAEAKVEELAALIGQSSGDSLSEEKEREYKSRIAALEAFIKKAPISGQADPEYLARIEAELTAEKQTSDELREKVAALESENESLRETIEKITPLPESEEIAALKEKNKELSDRLFAAERMADILSDFSTDRKKEEPVSEEPEVCSDAVLEFRIREQREQLAAKDEEIAVLTVELEKSKDDAERYREIKSRVKLVMDVADEKGRKIIEAAEEAAKLRAEKIEAEAKINAEHTQAQMDEQQRRVSAETVAIIEAANAKKEEMLDDARRQGEEIINAAREEARQIIADANASAEEMNQKLVRVKSLIESIYTDAVETEA